MNKMSLLKIVACLGLAFFLAACTSETPTPVPLPTSTFSPTATLTPSPTQTPSPTLTPSLHTLDNGRINVLETMPTEQQLAVYSEQIIAEHANLTVADANFDIMGDAIKTNYTLYPFYTSDVALATSHLAGLAQFPDGTIMASMFTFNQKFQDQPEVFHLRFSPNVLVDQDGNPISIETLKDLLQTPDWQEHAVVVTVAIAPDVYFTPEKILSPEEIAQLQEEYKDVLEQMESRMITTTDGNSMDALKMFLKYNPELADNPNWTDEKMQQYREIIKKSMVPVIKITFYP